MTYRIKNCRIFGKDPALCAKNELLFTTENGASKIISAPPLNERITDIDGKGGLLFPAFTDIGCEFFDPSNPSRDSIDTASAAASVGGYRRLFVLGGPENRAGDPRVSNVLPIKNENIKKNALLYGKYGDIKREALLATFEKLKENNCLYVSAGIDENAVNGSFSVGFASKTSGKAGISRFDECSYLSDELFAAYESGCRIHIRAVGSAEALKMITDAKGSGVRVTVGVSPFHLALTENDVPFFGSMCKLLPPLRSKKDREALMEGIIDRSIDCISSLHSPRTVVEKSGSGGSSFGLCSFETVFSSLNTYFPELISSYPEIFAEVTAINPSRIFGEEFCIKEGGSADLFLADTESEMVVTGNSLRSKSQNSPFLGQTLSGRCVRLFINGV